MGQFFLRSAEHKTALADVAGAGFVIKPRHSAKVLSALFTNSKQSKNRRQISIADGFLLIP
jgi:hypothetical protein